MCKVREGGWEGGRGEIMYMYMVYVLMYNLDHYISSLFSYTSQWKQRLVFQLASSS